MTIDDVSTPALQNPIVLRQGYNPDGFYLHMSKSVLKWKEYSSSAGGVAEIIVSLEGDFPDYSLGIKNYESIYAQENESFEGVVTLSNLGANAVNNIKYTYTFDNSDKIYEGFY